MWILEKAPLAVSMALANAFVSALRRLLPSTARGVLHTLRAAGISEPEQTALLMLRNFARFAVVFARFPQLSREGLSNWVRIEGAENIHQAKLGHRGMLLVTAHLGNWELGAFAVHSETGPLHVVGWVEPRKDLDEYMSARRAVCGNHTIGNRGSARTVVRILEAGGVVAFAFDAETHWLKHTVVDFLGRPARVSTALARLAAITGAAVLPCFCLWSAAERRYVLHIEPALALSGDPDEDTQSLYRLLEARIRQYPDQWLWTRNPGWIA